MKHPAAVLIALAFLHATFLPLLTHAQVSSDNSLPAPLPDLMWSRVERMVHGQPMVVKPISGPSVHCRFAGATDAYLFCDPDHARSAASDYRFDRAQVIRVKISRSKVNWHPALLATVAAIGIATGAAASSQGASDKTAAVGGLVTALTVGAIGYPIAVMQEQDRGFAFTVPLPPLGFSALHTGPAYRRHRASASR